MLNAMYDLTCCRRHNMASKVDPRTIRAKHVKSYIAIYSKFRVILLIIAVFN